MKHGNRPRKPSSCRSCNIPCFQVVSHVFSRLKKIAITCSFLIKASLTKVSNLTKWSTVEQFIQNPHWTSEQWPSDSRHHISCAFTMCSMVLPRQLVSVMSLKFVGFLGSLPALAMGTKTASILEGGKVLDSKTVADFQKYRQN